MHVAALLIGPNRIWTKITPFSYFSIDFLLGKLAPSIEREKFSSCHRDREGESEGNF